MWMLSIKQEDFFVKKIKGAKVTKIFNKSQKHTKNLEKLKRDDLIYE